MPSGLIEEPAASTETQQPSKSDVLQHAIDVARDGMAIFDRDLQLAAWNPAFVAMFQLPRELMEIGMPLETLIRSAAERGAYGPVDVEAFVASRWEFLLHPTEGSRLDHAAFGRILELRSVRLHDGGLFLTYSDATAHAKSEEELETENETLEHRVRERTDELHRLNLELARAQAEAEDANISKTRFLAAASHDLLQPLNAARLYTTALREQLRATGREDFNRLIKNVDLSLEAVEEILNALLEITQLDAGATQPDFTSFPIGEIFRQLAIEFEPIARARELKLIFMPCSLAVRSDRKLLRRLLQNLVSNALKYTSEGRVVVGARHEGGALRLEVHDTGIGIPKSKRVVIFREFERLPEAAQAAPGAGLGLSIVDRLSHVLNHEVTILSKVNRGSAFRVRVPRAPLASAVPQLVSRTAAPRSLAGLSIAAIDNEADVLSGMETLLKGWDCRVATGTDLPRIEAALAAGGFEPDVIIADFHMGDLDGLDVIAALRRRYGPRPAVLITADRATAIRHRAQGANVRVLHKPLKPAALRSLLSQWQLLAIGRADTCAAEGAAEPVVGPR